MAGGTSRRRPTYTAPPDGDWGWVVVIGSFVCMFIAFGFPRNLGLFIEPIVDDFESTTGPIGLIVSLPITLLLTTGPISGILCKKVGSRLTCMLGGILACLGLGIAFSTTNELWLGIGLGLLPGVGLGLAYTASVVIVSRYFEKKFIIANGLIFLGGPISFLICPIMGESLMEAYGWRRTILLWCGMVLNLVVGGTLMKPVFLLRDLEVNQYNSNEYELLETDHCANTDIEPNGNHQENRIWKKLKDTASYCGLELFRDNLMFDLIMVIIFLNGFSYDSWLIFVIPQAEELDIPDEISALILTFAGIGSVVGRLSQIGILHWKLLSTYNTWLFANVLAALALIMDPLFQNMYSIVTFSVIYGVATGIKMPLAPVLVRDFVGIEKIHVAFGWLNLARGVGALLGGTSMGMLHSYYDSYRQPFIVVAVVQSMAAVLLIFKPRDFGRQ
ncbi:monocarboxylate transporter 3-like [Antedon mediterranea]|uniref:monocarboxylate transporter 3-like n=1 Tax=Antedon mediterranea TaxID=105859 RepID=UPI003AF73EA3